MRLKQGIAALIALAAVGYLTQGCSSSDSDAILAAAGITISGNVAAPTFVATSVGGTEGRLAAPALSELELYGLAMSATPEAVVAPLTIDGTTGAASFALAFSAAARGAEITLIFRGKTGASVAGQEVGIVKFIDTTETDLNGEVSSSTSIPLSGSVSLGNLTLSEDGEVTVDVSTIQSSITTVTADTSTFFDFTGNWVFSAFDGTLPDGYVALCTDGDNSCNGPSAGMPIYLKRVAGKKFTPDATCTAAVVGETFDPINNTCGGAVGTEDRYSLMVWKSATSDNSCGTKLGFPYEAGKAFGRVDFSASGVTSGDFGWETTGYTDGWKRIAATATRDYQNCEQTSVTLTDSTVVPGWKCTDDGGLYHVSLQGGCIDSAGAPIEVTNWPLTSSNWTDNQISGYPAGYKSGTNTYTAQDHDGAPGTAAVDFTCTWVDGTFKVVDDAPAAPSDNYNWSAAGVKTQGDTCKLNETGTNQEKMASLRCFADDFWQNGSREDETMCFRDIRTDWSATTPETFIVKRRGINRAANLFVYAGLRYSTAGSATFEENEIYSEGVQVENAHITCKVEENFKMSFTKRSDTVLVSEFVTKTRLIDLDKPACVVEAAKANNQLRVGEYKSMMLLTKTAR